MANSLVSFREEESRRIEATQICETIGIDLPTYLRICISRLIQENGIPFSMNANDIQRKSLDAFKKANAIAKKEGISDMTLEEINEEIDKSHNK